MRTKTTITTQREIFLQVAATCADPEFFVAIIQAYNAMRKSFPVREETEKHTEPYVAYGEGASEVSTMKWERLSIAANISPTN